MIAIHKLCKAFGGKAVLQDFSCELEEGRVTALMAPSGAGKTTLLRILLGLETADSGEITGLSGKRLAAVFQEDRLLDFMTPVDNIRLPEPKLERAVILREMAAMGLTGCDFNYGVYLNNPTWLNDIKALKMASNVWTVNNPADMMWAIENRVDYITTDRPDLFLKLTRK